MSTPERVTLLLGAGASHEAGVPMSAALTQAITDRIAVQSMTRRHTGTAQALNLAIGALIAYDTSRGAGAYEGIDVERLFSAVQMLGNRDELEISPFVASWSSGLDEISTRSNGLPAFFADDFAKAVNKSDRYQVGRLFGEAVKILTRSTENKKVFQWLEGEMVSALIGCLNFDPNRLEYLNPLFTLGDRRPLRVATLNYDMTIETAARRAGIDLDTGIERWAGGLGWDWRPEAQVQLLKLHGSIDWLEAPLGGADPEPFRSRRYVSRESSGEDVFNYERLGVVFGQRGKLRANGPFLAMLTEFGEFLRTTDRLIVVGYSFRDEHINEVISQWIAMSADPCLTLVDPVLEDISHMYHGGPEMLGNLAWLMLEDMSASEPRVKGQHSILGMGAGAALQVIARGSKGRPLT